MVGTDLAWWDWRWKAVDGGERWQMVEFGGDEDVVWVIGVNRRINWG